MEANTSIAHTQPVGSSHTRGQRLIGALAIGGGMLMVIGTLLPWLSLFAGLQSYSGVVGLNGRLLLVSGAIAGLAGALFLVRSTTVLRWGIGLFGFVLLTCSGGLLIHLLRTYRDLAADPLLVAVLGPGLFVVLTGAALVFGTLFVNLDEMAGRSSAPERPQAPGSGGLGV